MAQAILFDLDGTLLDTAPDLLSALNRLRRELQLHDITLNEFKPLINLGSRAMVKELLSIDENDPSFPDLREQFFNFYEQNIAASTCLFPTMEKVLIHLTQRGIPWGIVTNKLSKQTNALLKALSLQYQPGCVICGDTLPKYKPDPEPILHACSLLKTKPNECIYVGDAATDVIASKAAGTSSLVALYGYIHDAEDPFTWQADGYIKSPEEILSWL